MIMLLNIFALLAVAVCAQDYLDPYRDQPVTEEVLHDANSVVGYGTKLGYAAKFAPVLQPASKV
jgi:hypothetical protein